MCGRDIAKAKVVRRSARHQGAWRASRRAESLFLSRNAPHRRRRFFKFFPARFLLALSNTGSSKGLKALLLLLLFFYLSGIHKAQPLIGALAASVVDAPLEETEQEELFKTLIQCSAPRERGNKTPYIFILCSPAWMYAPCPCCCACACVHAHKIYNSLKCARHFLHLNTRPCQLCIYLRCRTAIGMSNWGTQCSILQRRLF